MINFSIPLRRGHTARVLVAPCLLAGAFISILTQQPAAADAPAKPAKPAAAKPTQSKPAQAKPAAAKPAKPAAAKPAAPAKKLESYTETIPGTTVKIEMVAIPAGPGQKPFWIGKTELPWEAYDVYAYKLDESGSQPQKPKGPEAAAHPSKPYGAPDHGFGHQGYPTLSVTALAAFQFCAWLSEKTGKKYRLPNEKEWEYAARAGSTVQGPLPKEELDKIAWYWDNTQDKTEPVATKQPNAWGLYDMLGNAGEWCLTDKEGPLLCGGTYKDKADQVTYSSRKAYAPEWQQTDPQNPKSRWWLSDGTFVGFRILCEE